MLSAKVAEAQKMMEDFKINPDMPTVYTLGLTGSGKSSFISYMLGSRPTFSKTGINYSLKN